LNSPIEYVGQFPTIPLYRGQVNEIRRVFKRALDMVFSSVGLILLSPVLLAVAIAVKLDSPGPVFYFSERIGKKGRVFRCIRFRAVVRGAVEQRDGAAREIAGDPRTTRLGRFLRRYSLDELPQLFNVLRGDMSVVGPRPLRASDAGDSKLTSQRSLAVPPGLTGLWPVLGRQDPPSDSYISLDLLYIENWSVWLDIQIILRTMGMVFAGTGV
jgi:lipopolysaccharide/colanic/teichoic acid biosynthesis glycosyltransferase